MFSQLILMQNLTKILKIVGGVGEEASKIHAVQPLPDPAPRKYRAIQNGYHGNISQRFDITANHRRNPDREERAKQIDEHKIRVEFIIDPSVYSTEEMTSDPFIFNVTNAVERHHSR